MCFLVTAMMVLCSIYYNLTDECVFKMTWMLLLLLVARHFLTISKFLFSILISNWFWNWAFFFFSQFLLLFFFWKTAADADHENGGFSFFSWPSLRTSWRCQIGNECSSSVFLPTFQRQLDASCLKSRKYRIIAFPIIFDQHSQNFLFLFSFHFFSL